MIDVKLDKRDAKLVEMYLALYNTATISVLGTGWIINFTEGSVEFMGYKGFIKYVEEEVKSALLTYAFNNELAELVELLG